MHRESGRTIRGVGGTSEGIDPGGNTGEVPHNMTLGDPVKYNTGGVPG